MAGQIENLKIIDLIPYTHNARTHSEAQVKQIVDSITEFGFTNPVLVRMSVPPFMMQRVADQIYKQWFAK